MTTFLAIAASIICGICLAIFSMFGFAFHHVLENRHRFLGIVLSQVVFCIGLALSLAVTGYVPYAAWLEPIAFLAAAFIMFFPIQLSFRMADMICDMFGLPYGV